MKYWSVKSKVYFSVNHYITFSIFYVICLIITNVRFHFFLETNRYFLDNFHIWKGLLVSNEHWKFRHNIWYKNGRRKLSFSNYRYSLMITIFSLRQKKIKQSWTTQILKNNKNDILSFRSCQIISKMNKTVTNYKNYELWGYIHDF